MKAKWIAAVPLVALLAVAAGCGSNKSASGVAGAQKTVVNKSVKGTVTFDASGPVPRQPPSAT